MRHLGSRTDEQPPVTAHSTLQDVVACPAASLAAWVLSTGETSAAPLDAAALGAVTRVLQAIDSLPDAFMVLDLQGIVRWASSGTTEVLGWHPKDLTGRPISVLALEENVEQQQHFLDDLQLTGRSGTFTTHHRRGDGSAMEVSVSMAPIRSAAGEVVGNCASVRNTTQQTRLLTQLAQQENVSVMLNRRSSDVSLISKPDTEITYISPSVIDVLGHTPEQIVGTKGLMFVHEDDLPEVTAFVTRVVSTPDAVERLTFRITKAQGDWIWIEETLTNCVNVPGVQGLVPTSET